MLGFRVKKTRGPKHPLIDLTFILKIGSELESWFLILRGVFLLSWNCPKLARVDFFDKGWDQSTKFVGVIGHVDHIITYVFTRANANHYHWFTCVTGPVCCSSSSKYMRYLLGIMVPWHTSCLTRRSLGSLGTWPCWQEPSIIHNCYIFHFIFVN